MLFGKGWPRPLFLSRLLDGGSGWGLNSDGLASFSWYTVESRGLSRQACSCTFTRGCTADGVARSSKPHEVKE